jgi:hypothetical protein
MTVGREQPRALLSRIDQHPERREELRCLVLAQELLALPAVVAQQGDRLDRVEGVPLDCAMRWLAASRERRPDFLRRLLAAAERLAATFHEVEYQDERMAWQEERTGSNGAWSGTTRSWLIWENPLSGPSATGSHCAARSAGRW